MKDHQWPSITAQQADVVRGVLKGVPAKQAYIDAGYKARGNAAEVGASKLIRTPKVAKILERERLRLARSAQMTVEEVALRLSWLARSDPADFFHVSPDGVRVKDMDELTEAQRYCLRSASQTVTQHGGSIKIQLADPKPALDTLANWLGMLTKKVEVAGPGGGPIEVAPAMLKKLKPEELEQLVQIRKKLEDAESEEDI